MDEGWEYPLHHGTIDGVTYITDQFLLLPVAQLGGLPVGYDKVLELRPIRPQAMDGFAMWMNATAVDEPSDRVFFTWLLDPVELAGFRVRPLTGVKDAHAICGDRLEVVGLVIPVGRNKVEASDRVRVAV